MKIIAGVIGAGHLGKMHIKNLKSLAEENEHIEFAGAFDTDKDKLSEINKEFCLPDYNTFEDFLNAVNTVYIVTPTSTHFDIASRTISSGINTFIEKPVCDTIEEAQKLIKLAEQSKVKVQVGHIERFNPALLALENYKLSPLFIETHRLSLFNPRGTDVSVIQDLMIHDIDVILNLVKSEVKSIDANGVSVITDKIDIANARLKFENGCVANVTASRISKNKMRKMRLFQKDHYISIDFQNNSSEVFKLTREDNKPDEAFGPFEYDGKKLFLSYNVLTSDNNNPMKYEQMKFIESIINDTEPIVTLKEGVQALVVAHAVTKTISENQLGINI